MAYKPSDFPQLQQELLGEGSLWHMLRKDLEQIVASPSYFDKAWQPELGSAPNLSLMIVAMSGLETMATLANIDGLLPGGNAHDVVQRFTERYFPMVSPLYNRSKDESLPMLIWEAYRNGGLHRFFPKRDEMMTAAGKVLVTFSLSWPEQGSPDMPDFKRSLSLENMRNRKAFRPAPGIPGSKHLSVEVISPGSVNFWVSAPIFTLELVDAVEIWRQELAAGADKQAWFHTGAEKLEEGLKLRGDRRENACLKSMIDSALAASEVE